jgi:hypothetical protein
VLRQSNLGQDIKEETGRYLQYPRLIMNKAFATVAICTTFLLVAFPSSMSAKDCSGGTSKEQQECQDSGERSANAQLF